MLCVVCCLCAGSTLKSPLCSQSLNISFLLLCISLFYVGVVLFLFVVFFMDSILAVGGLGFLTLVFLLGFRVSLFCAGVVLLLCVVFFTASILAVGGLGFLRWFFFCSSLMLDASLQFR